MSTTTTSIIGVDGAGKTTLLQHFKDHKGISTLFVPQYNLAKTHPLTNLAVTLERIGAFADDFRQPSLKAAALFTAMSLFGRITKTLPADQILTERHPSLDCLVYSQFYGAFLNESLRPDNLRPRLMERMNAEALRSVEEYCLDMSNGIRFWDFPLWMKDILGRSPDEQLQIYSRLFRTDPPDQVFFIRLGQEFLQDRLAQRTNAHRELHEQIPLLMQLQAGYEKLLRALPIRQVVLHHCDSDHDANRMASVLRSTFFPR